MERYRFNGYDVFTKYNNNNNQTLLTIYKKGSSNAILKYIDGTVNEEMIKDYIEDLYPEDFI